MKRIIVTRAAVFAAAIAAGAALSAAELAYDTLISHRGESVDAPENTLPAYKTAVERGFGFECDVYLSNDGRVFTFHDKTLKRTTGGANTNACGDVSWGELSRLDVGAWGKWKGSKFAGTRPALLEEVLGLARDGRWIYVEVKPGPEIVPYIKDVFGRQTQATPVNTLFIVGNTNTLAAIKKAMPQYKAFWCLYSRKAWLDDAAPWTAEEIVSVLKATGSDGVDFHYNPEITTADMISHVKKAGFEFHVWTVDDFADAREAFRRGAQTVTTNCAKKLLDESTRLEIAMAGYLAFGQPTGNYYEAITKHCGLQVIHADGAVTVRLKELKVENVKCKVDGSNTVALRMQDEHYPFEVTRYVRSWDDCAAVETWAEIRHEEVGAVRLVRADSFAAPVASAAWGHAALPVRVMSLTGIAKNEANVSEAALANGQTLELVSSAGTRDAWEANAAMMVGFGDGVDEEHGKVLGVALEWAGTSCRRVRRNWDGKVTEVFAGIDMTTGPYTLDPGVTFTTPKAILVWSERGRGEVSREFHRWAHRHLMPHGYDLHPVLLNSWEGSYFSFTEQTLLDMMDGVKEMGGEMFVLDDGWFGRDKYARDEVNKATAGLGDWCVNANKLPHGLGWIADEAKRRGLKFGLWVEPEMANTNSWLYQEHPDWVLREAGRPLVCGRGKSQVVLDLCNPAVRDNIFKQIDAVYSAIPSLAYVKWDCNANIWNPGSPYLDADHQPNLWYDYAMGYNELMARFQAKSPHVMVQACASGGGRMDFGSLRYADEFWPSDCTDPYQRIFIQWGCSQFYPASAMACHVTASPNHQTKRETPLKYRFDVAMTGRLGFELHPKDMTADEISFAKAAVADYKRIRPVVQRGDFYRLVSPYEKPLAALMYVDSEGPVNPVNPVKETPSAVVFALGLKIEGDRTETLHLRGLDSEATYSIKEINSGEWLHFAWRVEDNAPYQTATGRELMECGIAVMLSGDYDSAVFELKLER